MKFTLDLNNFEACPQYNDWLDQQYVDQSDVLDIFGFQPRPSFVLFSLSQDTYQTMFADFLQECQEDMKQSILEEFPSPIGCYFYRFEKGSENELQRLQFLRDTWEAIIDILHAVAVAECRFRHMPLSEPIKFAHLLSDSVAQRLLNIERIIKHANSQSIALSTSRVVSIATLQTMRELNQTRNAFSHSAAQSESQARELIGACYGDLIDVLDDLRYLAKIEILRYKGQVDGCTLRCEVFCGHALTRTIKDIPLTANQVRDSQQYFQQGQVLISCNGDIFSLRPLIFYREDASGHTTKLCMFRRTHGVVPDRRIEYEVVGESVRWDQDRILFGPELNELRALFGLGPD